MAFEKFEIDHLPNPEQPNAVELLAFQGFAGHRVERIEHTGVERNWKGETRITDLILVLDNGLRLRLSSGGPDYWVSHGKASFLPLKVEIDYG